ncbi:MAG TPA: protein kinase, partial [Candidatus Krumholzibacteria bacterium]|nr:protein kinase [Candidatus Krumholzibacteria bacterium]
MQSGTKLGHWVVRELIGKGGMGEVYRARDTKLDRDVALKILPPEVAGDSDRLARFEREAKLLASLNHPNIASIFGIDEADGIRFLVMELVEGRDLAAILKGGPLPVDEAVDVARQIAEGLEEAHEKGIVHRDLKPANVKRTPEGKVKVLDFGLARAYAGQAAGEEAVSSAPTMTAAMTQVGVVLGTAAYMSPEQARGKEVDRRADIWAFGVILFEMLTGKQAFVGETASDTLAGILKSEPEWSALPAGLPFQVERVLRRCLAKDPRQRLRDIGEARVRLQHPEAESGAFSGALAAVPDAARGRGLRPALPWALLGLCLAAVGWLAAHRADAPAAKHPLHVAVPTADQVVFHTVGTFPGLPEISADGSHIVYCGVDPVSNAVQAYVRALDSDATTMLPGAENAQYPFLSPDGAWVAYYDRATGLFRMPVAGGPAQRLCSAANGKGGSWGENGQILLVPDFNAHIEVVPAAGGEPRAVTDLAADQGFNSHRHPQWLPDGKHFLYLARSNSVPLSEVRMADVDGGPAKVIMTNDSAAFYASGHLLYAVRGTLMARPFDPATGALGGE